jgi:hypothetical protein
MKRILVFAYDLPCRVVLRATAIDLTGRATPRGPPA